jgi:hypothetical protein
VDRLTFLDLRESKRGVQRVDRLNEVDDAVGCVPAVPPIVNTANVKVGFDYCRIDKCPVQPDHYCSIDCPKLFVILGSFGYENNLGDLAFVTAGRAPLAILFLHIAIFTCSKRGATVVTVTGNEKSPRKTHPHECVFGDYVYVNFSWVVELAATTAGRARGDATGKEVAPVVVERRTHRHVAKRCWSVKTRK